MQEDCAAPVQRYMRDPPALAIEFVSLGGISA